MTLAEFEKWAQIILYRLKRAGRADDDRAVVSMKSLMEKVRTEGVDIHAAPSAKPATNTKKEKKK